MKFVALNTAIVVIAEAHNASILHPSFLSSQKIVPSDWQATKDVICTPAMSIVKYDNGIIFTAEPKRLMIRDDAPKPTTPIAELAQEYVKTLPHVHYEAVGVNFSGYVECSDAEKWLINRFVKPGPGNDATLKPTTGGVRLIYQIDRSTLTLGCDAGTVKKNGETTETPCLLINGNYHTAISKENSRDETLKAISLFPNRLAHFTEMTDIIFELNK